MSTRNGFSSMRSAGALAVAAAAASLLMAQVTPSRAAGDPGAGQRLAERVCADCHRLPGGVGGGHGPALGPLSPDRSFSPAALAEVLATSPHAGDLQLGDRERQDLAAYLEAAAPKSGQPAAPLSLEQVIRRVSDQGYSDIHEVEREGRRRYEVNALNAEGARVELYVDAESGRVLEVERDDD